MHFAKPVLLGLLAISVALVVILSAGVHSPLSTPGGGRFIAEAAAPLLIYMLVVVLAQRIAGSAAAYRVGVITGALGAGVQIIHMSLEAFGSHVGDASSVTFVFMGMAFGIWGWAGFWISRLTGKASQAVRGAGLSAGISMTIVVAYGILLAAAGYPDANYVATWPEFKQSSWNDVRSFAIANCFDAVFTHLVTAPVLGMMLGGLGHLVAAVVGSPTQRAHNAQP